MVHLAPRATIYWLYGVPWCVRSGSSLKRSPDARRNRCRGNCAFRELLLADTLYYIDSRARESSPVSPQTRIPRGDGAIIPWRVVAAALLASLSFIVTRDELANAFPPQFPAKDSFNGIV